MFWLWFGFITLVFVLLALDLLVFHRKAHVVRIRESLLWSGVWVVLALAFNVFIYFAYEHHWLGLGMHPGRMHHHALNGRHAAVLFFTGYVIEESLSVDNLFVMALVFNYFRIPAMHQHRVLFWGIVGAQAMRGTMILAGTSLIARFDWLLYGFGLFLLYTAYKMLFSQTVLDADKSRLLRWIRRTFPVTDELHGMQFLAREAPAATEGSAAAVRPARWVLTPLALALVSVETMDLLFAVDSIPAIFAITTDPFLIFTSNVFAILGLRSLYFALAGIMGKFRYLHVSLAAVLALVGVKMLAKEWLRPFRHTGLATLAAVALILGAGVVASVLRARRAPRQSERPPIA